MLLGRVHLKSQNRQFRGRSCTSFLCRVSSWGRPKGLLQSVQTTRTEARTLRFLLRPPRSFEWVRWTVACPPSPVPWGRLGVLGTLVQVMKNLAMLDAHLVG